MRTKDRRFLFFFVDVVVIINIIIAVQWEKTNFYSTMKKKNEIEIQAKKKNLFETNKEIESKIKSAVVIFH